MNTSNFKHAEKYALASLEQHQDYITSPQYFYKQVFQSLLNSHTFPTIVYFEDDCLHYAESAELYESFPNAANPAFGRTDVVYDKDLNELGRYQLIYVGLFGNYHMTENEYLTVNYLYNYILEDRECDQLFYTRISQNLVWEDYISTMTDESDISQRYIRYIKNRKTFMPLTQREGIKFIKFLLCHLNLNRNYEFGEYNVQYVWLMQLLNNIDGTYVSAYGDIIDTDHSEYVPSYREMKKFAVKHEKNAIRNFKTDVETTWYCIRLAYNPFGNTSEKPNTSVLIFLVTEQELENMKIYINERPEVKNYITILKEVKI